MRDRKRRFSVPCPHPSGDLTKPGFVVSGTLGAPILAQAIWGEKWHPQWRKEAPTGLYEVRHEKLNGEDLASASDWNEIFLMIYDMSIRSWLTSVSISGHVICTCCRDRERLSNKIGTNFTCLLQDSEFPGAPRMGQLSEKGYEHVASSCDLPVTVRTDACQQRLHGLETTNLWISCQN